jgi:polar amino acid transport system substrate-binding protein
MPTPDPNRLQFPSQSRARAADRRKVLIAGVILAAVFLALVPFAKVRLPEVPTFIPVYQGALAIGDLATAVLLYAQFNRLRSRSLLLLAGGYLFAALMAVIHALTFPGLFAPDGLLGAGPQTTAWLYMFWHGGFPTMVVLYGLLKDRIGADQPDHTALVINILTVLMAVGVLTLVATVGAPRLPPIMAGNTYTPLMIGVVTAVWAFSLAAFLVLWLRMPYSVLDIWLMLVMAAWMFEVALSAVLNAGRFDVGFYAGRLFGLAAGTYVLIMLLLRKGRSL